MIYNVETIEMGDLAFEATHFVVKNGYVVFYKWFKQVGAVRTDLVRWIWASKTGE